MIALDIDDHAFDLLPAQLAVAMVQKAAQEMATALVPHKALIKAAEMLDEFSLDVQADFVAEMEKTDTDAVLEGSEDQNAEVARRLIAYQKETADPFMNAEVFSWPQNAVVGTVLRPLVSEDEDFELYREQPPICSTIQASHSVCAPSLHGLLTDKRRMNLTKIMVAPIRVSVKTPLKTVEDSFEAYPFLGPTGAVTNGQMAECTES